jgi:acetyl-CoA acetyltransferase
VEERGVTQYALRGQTAVIGVGESIFYKHGRSPHSEFRLVLDAILAACADAGIDPKQIDGFSSFSGDRNDPSRLAAALGVHEMRYANMFWGGGGGVAASVGNAAAAIITGMAKCVVVFRGIAQGQFGRFGDGATTTYAKDSSYVAPYGVLTPAHWFALRVTRFMHDHGVEQSALRAVALASYHHAQANPRAVMRGKQLSEQIYDQSRWIVEPFHLYDCCMENDCAAAIVMVAAEEARDCRQKPAYLLGCAQGSEYRNQARVYNAPDFASASFSTVGPRLFEQAGVKPSEVDVAQSYENFTGGVVMSMVEHGFCRSDEANTFFTVDNLTAPKGKLPLNTSGGNLAEAYIHGMGLVVEAARQVQGRSTGQVPGVDISFVGGGPMVSPVSSLLLGSGDTL